MLGTVYAQRNEFDRAEAMFMRALELAEILGDKQKQAAITGNLGLFHKQQGNTLRACQYWMRTRDLFQEIGMMPEVGLTEELMRDARCRKD